MGSWKDKVAKKLSRILADNSSSSPRPPPVDSSVAPPGPQAIFSQQLASRKKSSFSSHFLSLLSPTSCFDASEKKSSSRGARSSSRSSHASEKNSSSRGARSSPRISHASEQNSSSHGARSSPRSSHPSEPDSPCLGAKSSPRSSRPKRWKVKFFTWKDRPSNCLEECGTGNESNKILECSRENTDNFPNSHINGSHSTSHDPGEYLSYLTEKSTFMSAELFEFFQSSLPNIVKGCQWILLYSTWKHGISLHTLFRNSVNLPGPCLLIVGDMQGAVFGGLLDSPLNPTAKRKYQGTNQTFVFTTIYGEPRLFRATGANRYYYLCLNNVLAFGGGGRFALYLDEDLLHGTSGPCETFGSLCLAHSPEFELKNVELWGFAHSSRCLT